MDPDTLVTLSDATKWRNRNLPQLAARLAAVLSSSRPAKGHLPDTTLACAAATEEALLEANSGAVNVKALWAADGQKGGRSRRKKMLVDYMKSLLAIGVAPHRSAVPADQRAPAAWFQTPQVTALVLPGVAGRDEADPRTPELTPHAHELCAGAWEGSSVRQQQAVACLHQLWVCDGTLHPVRSHCLH